MRFYTHVVSLIIGLLAVATPLITHAAMDSSAIANACNALALESFGLKDLVLVINANKAGAAMTDVFDEFNDLFDAVLDNIGLITGTLVIADPAAQQSVYEAYSYFVQGLFELMDGISTSATTFITLDSQNEFRIPMEVQTLRGVVDAYFFNVISVFPANSSYSSQSNNQKGQVDSHFRQAVQAFHLATAKSPQPYSNITSAKMRMRL